MGLRRYLPETLVKDAEFLWKRHGMDTADIAAHLNQCYTAYLSDFTVGPVTEAQVYNSLGVVRDVFRKPRKKAS